MEYSGSSWIGDIVSCMRVYIVRVSVPSYSHHETRRISFVKFTMHDEKSSYKDNGESIKHTKRRTKACLVSNIVSET
jgi:hypothetical protein